MTLMLPPESLLSLHDETKLFDTGHYFCYQRPFSIPRAGNKVSMLSCGSEAMEQIHAAMLAAESFIWIADWQMACDVELASRGAKDYPGRLHNVIRYIISTKKVHIRILLYMSIKDSVPGTYDSLVMNRLNALNRVEYPGSVHVVAQPSTSAQNDSHEYSHHQKFVVVDGRVGFLGGIDLSYGRWETPEFDVVIDPERHALNDMYNPCQVKLREVTTIESKKIEKYELVSPYGKFLLDEGCQPRMPWQDVHVKIDGPSVVDIHRNFVRRWNSRLNEIGQQWRGELVRYRITEKWLNEIGGWNRLAAAQTCREGGAQVQIVRSVSSAHLRMEGHTPEDLSLHPDRRDRHIWQAQLKTWCDSHQSNIHEAVVNCIRSADNYIYIETQFFISNFGRVGKVDSRKIGNEDDGFKNAIVDELWKRIDQHIRAQPANPFHVYLVIPTHPEGMMSEEAVWKQHWLAMATIMHGSESLINRIKRSLQAKKRDPEEWIQYLTVLNMRNYGATVLYARDPKTFDEDFAREIGRYVVTEQIYIHSKLIIVDDAVAIVGSANTNDRSLTGNGDTEIAAVVVDTEGVELRDLGAPGLKVQTRKFARELRQQLWRKHFGFLVDSGEQGATGYFDSTTRAVRAKKLVPTPITHPPRVIMDQEKIARAGQVSWIKILERPCDPVVVKAIQKIALDNSKAYEAVFSHTPRNHMTKFEEVASRKFYTLPYPPLYSVGDTQLWTQSVENFHRDEYTLSRGTREESVKANATYQKRVRERIRSPVGDLKSPSGKSAGGVIPPALQPAFMTKKLLQHQLSALDERSYAMRQQLYADGTVHDVASAIDHLSRLVVGFFVAAPLHWGRDASVSGDPSKATAVSVDIG